MKLLYLIPRLIRHFMPQPLTQALLRRSIIIHPGKETSDPQAALVRYRQVLEEAGLLWQGKRVLVFGYGGYFGLGCSLLEAGAGHVILCDKYASPDHRRNLALAGRYPTILERRGGKVLPRSGSLSLLQVDIRQVTGTRELEPVDLVLSSDVFEHLEDVDGIARALSCLTKPDGVQVHFIDLRDHYFKYPFEMLCYSETVWRNWLNPGSNLNRFRAMDYRQVFERYFDRVNLEPISKDEQAFRSVYPRIRPEFLAGDPDIDAITRIRVLACSPRKLQTLEVV